MIPEVKNGQKITAELQNQIIEAANGQMIPSEGQFVTTKSGPVFSSGVASTTSNPTLVPEQIFHCMYATTYTIDSRSDSGTQYDMQGNSRTKAWFVSLVDKDNVMEMLQNNSPLSVADFGVLGKSASLDGKFESAWLNRTNWLDTGYDELSAEPSFAWIVEKKEDEEEEEEQPKVIYAVLHNENDVENAKQRIAQLFDFEDVEVIKNGKLAVYDDEKQTTRQLLFPTLGSEPQEVSCDSEISAASFKPTALSSIQHISTDVGYALELFKFNDISAYENIALSSLQKISEDEDKDGPEWTLLARHYDDDEKTAVLQYIKLSGMLSVDTEVDNKGLSSIDKIDDGILTLHNFKEKNTDWQFDLSSMLEKNEEYQFLVRHIDQNIDEAELQYASLSALNLSSLLSAEISAMISAEISNVVSSAVDETINNTLSVRTDSGKIDVVNNETSSVQTQVIGGETKLELYNFHSLTPDKNMALSDLIDDNTHPQNTDHILVRHYDGDHNTLQYVSLSSLGISADVGTTVDVDAQYMSTKFPHRYSIDWMPDADNDDKVLQMYRFDESPTNSQYKLRFDDDAQVPQNTISADFIVREYSADAGGVNMEVNYQDGKEVVVPHEVTDGERYAQTGNGHVSINYAQGQQGEPKALQLYNFSSYSTTSDANGLSANGDGILIRKKSSGDNHLELQYLNVTGLKKLVSIPSLSALDGLSVVTGIEYPMTGTNQYKIVAHRKQINVVNDVLTVTNLADQTIDTVAHDSIYPNN